MHRPAAILFVSTVKQVTPRTWYVAFVGYFVAALYLVPSSAAVDKFSFSYFALIVPAWVYIFINAKRLLEIKSFAALCMAAFAVLATVIGAVKADWALAYNSCFIAAIAISILNGRVYLTLKELNVIFLCAVVGSIIIYILGLTIYGFLLGQAEAPGCHRAMNWKVSLFRVTAESAAFSLIVLCSNILYGKSLNQWLRIGCIFLAAYFLVFSGVRTVVLTAILILPICVVAAVRQEAVKLRSALLTGGGIVAAIIFIPMLLGTELPHFWKNYALRTDSCDFRLRYGIDEVFTDSNGVTIARPIGKKLGGLPSDWLGRTINRHCAAAYQLHLFSKFPLGTPAVKPESDSDLTNVGCLSDQAYSYCVSCNFATYWLARAGIGAIPLLLCFLSLIGAALKVRNLGAASMLLAFGVISLGWGGMFAPYNFIFLLMLSVPAFADVHARMQRNE